MTITAQVICDSVNEYGNRLTTFQLRYPRFIHAEFMTHRVFSRNARSSRAVPIAKMIEDVRTDPVFPSFWGKNQPGMQAREELPECYRWEADGLWTDALENALDSAQRLARIGVHKQIVNRLLEPFAHIDVLVTATEYANFFVLRDHPDAQPEIRYLAEDMSFRRFKSTPELLKPGEWHLPYVSQDEAKELGLERARKVSVARCARVSYAPFEGNANIDKELERYKLLIESKPMHASPAEHQATPDTAVAWLGTAWKHPHQHGNFIGFRQFRKLLPGEYVQG